MPVILREMTKRLTVTILSSLLALSACSSGGTATQSTPQRPSSPVAVSTQSGTKTAFIPVWPASEAWKKIAAPAAIRPNALRKDSRGDVEKMLTAEFSECSDAEFLQSSEKTLSRSLSSAMLKNSTDDRIGKCQVRASIREGAWCQKVREAFRSDCEKLESIVKKSAENGFSDLSGTGADQLLYRKYFFDPNVFPPKKFAVKNG